MIASLCLLPGQKPGSIQQRCCWVSQTVSRHCRWQFLKSYDREHRLKVCTSTHAALVPASKRRLQPDQPNSSGLATAAVDSDTIAAVVTGAQQGSVAIIRLSGPDAVQIATSVFTPSRQSASWAPKTHRIYHGHVLNDDGAIIDEVLLLSMLAPKSYTSEDVIELQCHGGGVCVQRVLGRCLTAGARLAKPGEFTLRAFLNGRLDLSQAESVNELVGARTVAAADSAIAGLTGGIGAMVQGLRRSALVLLAELEAMIDFEEDVPDNDAQRLQHKVQDIAQGIQQALDTASRGRLLKDGLQVVLVGRPNVGKSSLLNAWSGTDKAIVTQVAGTTRDIVQADVVLGGIPVSLLDTAGMREASDVVERLGVQRSRAAAVSADVTILVLDAQAGWTADDQTIFDHLWGRAVPGSSPAISAPSILVWNKVDLTSPQTPHATPNAPQQTEDSTANRDAASGSDAGDASLSAAQQSKAAHQQASTGHGNLQEEEDAHAISRDNSVGPASSLSASQAASLRQQGSVQHSSAQEQQPQGSESQMRQYSESLRPKREQASPQGTASSSLNTLAARTQPDIEATATAAAAAAVTASGTPLLTANERSGSLTSASTSIDEMHCHDQEAALAADGARQAVPLGIPTDCSGCFAASVQTCATSGLGLDVLSAALLQLANAPSLASGGVGWAVNSRQAEALICAKAALADVMDSIQGNLPIDFWTVDMRVAVSALGEVSGDDVTEEVLDSVFSQFCIGK